MKSAAAWDWVVAVLDFGGKDRGVWKRVGDVLSVCCVFGWVGRAVGLLRVWLGGA